VLADDKFISAVAAAFGVNSVGTADQIMAQITGAGWTQHWKKRASCNGGGKSSRVG
jgi:hypothetical protein